MKRFFAIGLLLIGASVMAAGQTSERDGAHAQAACRMTLAQAPAVGGLKLGMTPEQTLALFPGSRDDGEVRVSLSRPATQFGESTLIVRPQKYATKARFPGVEQISFKMLDGRIYTFQVGYEGVQWKHVDDFVTKFTQGRNLPPASAWEAYVGMDTQLKTLKCKEFEISVFAGGKNVNVNYVQLIDKEAERKLKERKAKAREMRGN